MTIADEIRQAVEKMLADVTACEQWGTFGVQFDVAGRVITEWRDTSERRHRPAKSQVKALAAAA